MHSMTRWGSDAGRRGAPVAGLAGRLEVLSEKALELGDGDQPRPPGSLDGLHSEHVPGVAYFRSYDLRHTCATLLLYEGRTLNELAEPSAAPIPTSPPAPTRTSCATHRVAGASRSCRRSGQQRDAAWRRPW
jgi:hypothetical protein